MEEQLNRNKIHEDLLIADVKRVKEKVGEIPSKKQYREFGQFSASGIEYRFGSWNKFLEKVFGIPRGHRNIPKVSIKCCNPNCNKTLIVRETDLEDRYCSRACSNHTKPRRKRNVVFCVLCGGEAAYRRKYCNKCLDGKNIGSRTVDSFRLESADANRYSSIREHARKMVAALPDRCEKCGYDKHVQVCHRSPIKSFDGSSLISEVNARENLVKLCPNHHWELDHGLLELDKFSGSGFEPQHGPPNE